MNRQELLDWCRKQYGTNPNYPWDDDNVVLLEGPEPDEEVQGPVDLSYRLTQSNNCK